MYNSVVEKQRSNRFANLRPKTENLLCCVKNFEAIYGTISTQKGKLQAQNKSLIRVKSHFSFSGLF